MMTSNTSVTGQLFDTPYHYMSYWPVKTILNKNQKKKKFLSKNKNKFDGRT